MSARDALGALLHILWPAFCPVCGALGRPICEGCLSSLTCAPVFVCLECGTDAPCDDHRGGPEVAGAAPYDALNREMIHAMKYRGAYAVAWMIGREMASRLPRPAADVLVPIPLHRGSGRGYNQAELIARAAGEVWGMVVSDSLVWRRGVKRQALSSGDSRDLPRCAIMATRGARFGGRVCLVDDVRTSGGTMRAARDAVVAAGGTVTAAAVWSVARRGG